MEQIGERRYDQQCKKNKGRELITTQMAYTKGNLDFYQIKLCPSPQEMEIDNERLCLMEKIIEALSHILNSKER